VLRSTWLLFVYVAFFALSASAPFVATLGYVWVDTFSPQNVTYFVLNQLPVAMIMGAVAVGGYVLFDRRSPPPRSAEIMLMIAMTLWTNLTMLWAVAPVAAWDKWDWAVKTLAFATFIPFVIRSRVQIEAFAQIYVFSLAANFIPFGIKVMVSGGGYGHNLGLQTGNTGLSEGGLLSTACLMAVPLAIHLAAHGQLIPRLNLVPVVYWLVAALAIMTAVGTYERSALVGMVVLGGLMWLRSRRKLRFGVIIGIVACLLLYATSSDWNDRVATIGNFEQENSAYTRILVWRWVLEFTAAHPFGGGFESYLINRIEIPGTDGEPAIVQFGRAFHSIYFEVLGEQGYPGLAIFLLVTALAFFRLNRVAKQARADPELAWAGSLAGALQSGLAVFLSAGAFVGIAFQPMYWYFLAMSVSLNAYMVRVRRQERPSASHVGRSPIPGTRQTVTPVIWPPRRA
jgi:putative inorganic carbon (hco3(-)) transporter